MADGRLAYAEELTRVFRQVVGVVLISWQRVFRVGLITAALAIIATEAVACLTTGSFPPPPATHLVAVALAFSLGYGVALTALLAMLLRGGVRFIRHLEGDAEVGARAATVFARREVGDLGAGIRRIFSGRTSRPATSGTKATRTARTVGVATAAKAKPPRPARGVPAPIASTAQTAVAAVGLDVARAAIPRAKTPSRPAVATSRGGGAANARRDPDDAIMRASAPALQSLPVLASRMPRIDWTYDEKAQAAASARQSSASAPLSPAMPTPAPVATQAPALAEPPTSDRAADSAETLPAVDDVPASDSNSASADDLTTHDAPAAPDSAADTPVATRGTPDVPGLIPRGWHRNGNGSVTRPLPAVTRPLPAVTADGARTPGGVRSGGLWERVSQALVGQTGPADAAEPVASADDANKTQPLRDTSPASTASTAPSVEREKAHEDAWLLE